VRVLIVVMGVLMAGGVQAQGPSTKQAEAHRPYGPMASGAAANPYSKAWVYVNPAFRASVLAAASQSSDKSLADRMLPVGNMPTAIWLERIDAVAPEEGPGLAKHLDEALAQWKRVRRRGRMAVTLVVYNLPGRDCAASASNGELLRGELQRYQSEFIDPIAAILSQKAYTKLNIAIVLEPDSLPNLVTNMHVRACAASDTEYRAGITYAIEQLSTLANVRLYLDAGNSGWLGWDHTKRAAELYRKVIEGAGGPGKIRGFATNVSGYNPTFESFNPYADINRFMSVIRRFYQWNRVVDEVTFVDTFRASLGPEYADKGFIVDTARNGWKDSAERPSDRRRHRGNWCNVGGAGLGKRPQVTGVPGIDAWLWIKPPGESDGTGDPDAPETDGKRHDPECSAARILPGSIWPVSTDATPGAPHAGEWFQAHFEQLVRNAQPPL
jgi:cellulose 1,4-beta-cellobiosidase